MKDMKQKDVMRDKTSKIIGKWVRIHRIKQNFSQDGLAARSGLTGSYIGLIERGEKYPMHHTLCKIAIGLGYKSTSVIMQDCDKELFSIVREELKKKGKE